MINTCSSRRTRLNHGQCHERSLLFLLAFIWTADLPFGAGSNLPAGPSLVHRVDRLLMACACLQVPQIVYAPMCTVSQSRSPRQSWSPPCTVIRGSRAVAGGVSGTANQPSHATGTAENAPESGPFSHLSVLQCYSMANIRPSRTGLKMVIFVSTSLGVPHGPRIKVATTYGPKVPSDGASSAANTAAKGLTGLQHV